MTDREDDVPLAEVIRHPSAIDQPLRSFHNEREAALDELPVRTERDKPSDCDHRRTWVNEAARTLTCRDCDCAVDPISTLAQLARNREFYVTQARWLRNDLDRVRRELTDLERQERNAKARIRNARKRRDDEHALIAAATAGVAVGGYRPWEQLNDEQRRVVLEKVRTVVEAYAGALEHPAEEVA